MKIIIIILYIFFIFESFSSNIIIDQKIKDLKKTMEYYKNRLLIDNKSKHQFLKKELYHCELALKDLENAKNKK